MLNLVQHLIKSISYETLKQVQGDRTTSNSTLNLSCRTCFGISMQKVSCATDTEVRVAQLFFINFLSLMYSFSIPVYRNKLKIARQFIGG